MCFVFRRTPKRPNPASTGTFKVTNIRRWLLFFCQTGLPWTWQCFQKANGKTCIPEDPKPCSQSIQNSPFGCDIMREMTNYAPTNPCAILICPSLKPHRGSTPNFASARSSRRFFNMSIGVNRLEENDGSHLTLMGAQQMRHHLLKTDPAGALPSQAACMCNIKSSLLPASFQTTTLIRNSP